RDAPETPARDHLARLEAVAEVAQAASQRRGSLGTGEAVEARRGRAGHDALADALEDPLADALPVHRKQEHGDPGPTIGRVLRAEPTFDGRLALAADHRRGKARHRAGRLLRPR